MSDSNGISTELRLAQRERPAGPPVMYQSWQDLLFLHWRLSPADIQATLPPGLHVDLFEGEAYIGIVPFFMRRIRPRGLPAVSMISDFLELNVRTYVYDENGTPGVWFYSLDTNQPLAVIYARTFYKLPYFRAKMRATGRDPINYSCLRGRASGTGESHFRYQGIGATREAEPGSLEFFLTERYVLFAFDEKDQQLSLGRVHHPPYKISAVEVSTYDTKMMQMSNFDDPERPPENALYSPGVDVEVFPLEAVARLD